MAREWNLAEKKRARISNPVKNRVLENFSNMFFTLEKKRISMCLCHPVTSHGCWFSSVSRVYKFYPVGLTERTTNAVADNIKVLRIRRKTCKERPRSMIDFIKGSKGLENYTFRLSKIERKSLSIKWFFCNFSNFS